MTAQYITVRDAILRDLESAEVAYRGAVSAYSDAERKLHVAQGVASHAYDARAASKRNVDRLKKALALIEGDDE